MGLHPSTRYLRALGSARETFERIPRRKGFHCALTFDELLQLFKMSALGVRAVAQKAGVSHVWMRDVYNGCFRELCGGLSLEKRWERFTQRTYRANLNALLRNLPRDAPLFRILEEAKKHGCRTVPIISSQMIATGRLVTRRVMCNGWRTAILTSKKMFRPDPTMTAAYARFRLSSRTCLWAECIHFLVDIPGSHSLHCIIPTDEICRRHGDPRQWNRGRTHIYIPLLQASLPHRDGKWHDIEIFIAAWNLLPRKDNLPKAA